MILQTLYQQCLKNKVNFFDEYQVLDFIMVNGKAAGVVAVELSTGELHTMHAKAVIFATGGYGRVFEVTSNAYAYTGDGPAILSVMAFHLRIWNSSNSTRRVFINLAFSLQKAHAVKVLY